MKSGDGRRFTLRCYTATMTRARREWRGPTAIAMTRCLGSSERYGEWDAGEICASALTRYSDDGARFPSGAVSRQISPVA